MKPFWRKFWITTAIVIGAISILVWIYFGVIVSWILNNY